MPTEEITEINVYTLSRISVAEEVVTDKDTSQWPADHAIESRGLKRKATSRAMVIATVATLLIASLGAWFYRRSANAKWAKNAISQIDQ
jgi:hypothetical protein